MIVSRHEQWGTIGGGNLEYEITSQARKLLTQSSSQSLLVDISLGASMGQCCGGKVQVLMELVNPKPKIIVFGAGHVGKELIDIASQLPLIIDWVDERKDQFPDKEYTNVKIIVPQDCSQVLEDLEGNEPVVILTHNHALDLCLCEALMRQKHRAYIGLIGSKTKWRRFESQLLKRNFDSQLIAGIHCPVGVEGITSKNPRAIAIAILAQLLQNIALPGEVDSSTNSSSVSNL
tara:strand:- start:4279 stop:4977 length:699 start_codon:yes stop_codon:yes gene_type:complete